MEAVVKSHPVLTHPELCYVIPVTLVQADLGKPGLQVVVNENSQ